MASPDLLTALSQTNSTLVAWTSGSIVGSSGAIDVVNYASVVISFSSSGAITSGTVAFEASDDGGNTYYPIQVARADSFLTDSTFSLASSKQLWRFACAGLTNVGICLNTPILGNGAALLRLQASAGSIEPSVIVGGTVDSTFTAPIEISGDVTVSQGASGITPWAFALSAVDQLVIDAFQPLRVSGTVNLDLPPSMVTSGIIDAFRQQPVIVSGTVHLDLDQPIGVSGTVYASIPLPLGVSGTVSANIISIPQPLGVSGTVNIGSIPPVNIVSPISISGVVNTALPLPLAVSGTISSNVIGLPLPIGVSGTVSVAGFSNPLPIIISPSGDLTTYFEFTDNDQEVIINTATYGTLTVQLSGSMAGFFKFEKSNDGVVWSDLFLWSDGQGKFIHQIGDDSSYSPPPFPAPTNVNDYLHGDVAAVQYVRVFAGSDFAPFHGDVTFVARASYPASVVIVEHFSQPLGVSGMVSALTGPSLEVAGSGTISSSGDTIFIDVTGYSSITIQISGTLTTNFISFSSSLNDTEFDVFSLYSPGFTVGNVQNVGTSLFYDGMILYGSVASLNKLRIQAGGNLGGTCKVFWRLSPSPLTGFDAGRQALISFFHSGTDGEGNFKGVLSDETFNPIRVITRGEIFNGLTWDRIRSVVGMGPFSPTDGTGVLAVANMLYDRISGQWSPQGSVRNDSGAVYAHDTTACAPVFLDVDEDTYFAGVNAYSAGPPLLGDNNAGKNFGITGTELFNGAGWDRTRTANASVGTSGVGLAGAGILGYDGTNWQYVGITSGTHSLNVIPAGVSLLGTHTFSGDTFVDLDLTGAPGVVVSVSGLISAGFFLVYTSPDGVNFAQPRNFYSVFNLTNLNDLRNSTFGSPDVLMLSTGGMTKIRLRTFGGFSGPLAVSVFSSAASNTVEVTSPIPPYAFTTSLTDAYTNTTATPFQQVPFNNPVIPPTYPFVFNGVTWDRVRSANASNNTVGTGLPGAGILGYDGANWQYAGIASGTHALQTTPISVEGPVIGIHTFTTNNDTFDIELNGATQVQVSLSGDFTAGRIQPFLSTDGTNFYGSALYFSYTVGVGGQSSLGATAWFGMDIWDMPTAGAKKLRIKSEFGFVGGLNVTVRACPVPSTVRLSSLVGLCMGFPTLTDSRSNSLFTIGVPFDETSTKGIDNINLPFVFNGTTWDRVRSANAAANTTGTGLEGAGNLYWDGTDWQMWQGATPNDFIARPSSVPQVGTYPEIWNAGSNDFNLLRTAPDADGHDGRGLQGVGVLGRDKNSTAFYNINANIGLTNTALYVDGSQVTQPVSGTVNQGAPNAGGVNAWSSRIYAKNDLTAAVDDVAGGRADQFNGLPGSAFRGLATFAGTTLPRANVDSAWYTCIGYSLASFDAPAFVNGYGNVPVILAFDSLTRGYVGGTFTQEAKRDPGIYKSNSATASGSTSLWTPASGKKFRLMRYMITVSSDATQVSGGIFTIKLLDSSTDIGQVHKIFVPAVGIFNGGTLYTTPWIDLGNGILSSAANNILNINLPIGLNAGLVNVIAVGIEE